MSTKLFFNDYYIVDDGQDLNTLLENHNMKKHNGVARYPMVISISRVPVATGTLDIAFLYTIA